jgi:hypothetical protein
MRYDLNHYGSIWDVLTQTLSNRPGIDSSNDMGSIALDCAGKRGQSGEEIKC